MEVTGSLPTNLISDKITPAIAQQYLNNYLTDCIKKGEDPTKVLRSIRLDRSAFEAILSNKKCSYIRMYFGMPAIGTNLIGDYTIMVVGVDDNNENILEDGNIFDNGVPCPSSCPKKDFE